MSQLIFSYSTWHHNTHSLYFVYNQPLAKTHSQCEYISDIPKQKCKRVLVQLMQIETFMCMWRKQNSSFKHELTWLILIVSSSARQHVKQILLRPHFYTTIRWYSWEIHTVGDMMMSIWDVKDCICIPYVRVNSPGSIKKPITMLYLLHISWKGN